MAHIHPFMQRRGDNFYFRIQVPVELRQMVGQREFTRTLKTGDRAKALPLALELGAVAKRLFDALRQPTMSSSEFIKLLRAAREKLAINEIKSEHIQVVADLEEQHKREMRVSKLQAQVDTYERLLERLPPTTHASFTATPTLATEVAIIAPVPTFTHVLDKYLEDYPKDKRGEMFKKIQPALILLRDFIGDKPVNAVRQTDLNAFFHLVGRLPPKWAAGCKRLSLTPQELAKIDHPVSLSPKTFDDNYVVPVRLFLKSAIKDWQDQGFPTTLTTEGTEYQGDREEGENKQRAFTKKELERLFNGPELNAYKDDPNEVHKWWLPLIGLFTGARVREICQLNPMTDMLEDSDSGVPYFWITTMTESEKGIKKTTKNKVSRRNVPIHSTLVKLGFLDYLKKLQQRGAKQIFPSWSPNNGRASTQAEKWFREFLEEIGLRDDTAFAKITGMHAFRHTLLTRASNTVPRIDAGPITGHTDKAKGDQRGYEGEVPVLNKQLLLEAIDFGFELREVAARPNQPVQPESTD